MSHILVPDWMKLKSVEMKPGDVSTFKKGDGNAVVLAVGLWAAKSGKQLHIHITGPKNFHVTVTNDKDSKRHHRTLFRDLRRVLIANGCWPYGNEGEETDRRG
jgi:hypothetical protein